MIRLLCAACISLVFFAGGRYASGHEVEAFAEVALGAGWLGILYAAATRGGNS